MKIKEKIQHRNKTHDIEVYVNGVFHSSYHVKDLPKPEAIRWSIYRTLTQLTGEELTDPLIIRTYVVNCGLKWKINYLLGRLEKWVAALYNKVGERT